MSDEGLQQARDKMADAGVDPVAIDVFAHYYRMVESGETGMIPESTSSRSTWPALADVERRRRRRRGRSAAPRSSSSTAGSAPRWAWTGPSRCSRSATG